MFGFNWIIGYCWFSFGFGSGLLIGYWLVSDVNVAWHLLLKN